MSRIDEGEEMHDYRARPIASGLGFAEGPVALADGTVLATDLGSGWINAIDPASGHVERWVRVPGGPNGLAEGPDGFLYACVNSGMSVGVDEHGLNAPAAGEPENSGTPGVYRISSSGTVDALYTSVDGEALIGPNDLVFDESGGFYFTDFGGPRGRLVDLGGLYYGPAGGRPPVELIHDTRVSFPVTTPNGIALSPEGDTLYVAETAGGRVWEWTVSGPGRLEAPPNAEEHTGASALFVSGRYVQFDSMAVDSEGYLVLATLRRGGITVISPDGRSVEFVPLPQHDPRITNMCFGGDDLQTLFITAAGRGELWAMDWPRPGLALKHGRTFAIEVMGQIER